MFMKKSLALILAAALAAVSLAACGGGSTATTTAAAAPAETQAAAAEAAAPAEAAPAEAAPAEASDLPEPAMGADTLTFIQNLDPGTWQPSTDDEQGHARTNALIYDSLFRYSKDKVLEGALCESWEWDDDSHLRMHLRKGVKFSNGTDFTAEDVVWFIKYVHETNLPNSHFFIINPDDIVMEDEYTVILGTKYPCATLPNHLASSECGIPSKKAFEEYNGDYLNPDCAVGTGPYKLVSYDQGDRAVLTANEYSWREGTPVVKDLVIRFMSSYESIATEAKTRTYDVVVDANTREFDQIDAMDGVHVVYGQTAKTEYLLLNCKKAPMDDPKVREAFARAIDVTACVKLAYGSSGNPAQAFIVPGIAGSNTETYQKYYGAGHDIEAAKALLAEAGYPNGLDLEISVISANTQHCDMAEAMQAQVAEAGINLSINKMESAPLREYIDGGNHHMCINAFTAQTMEADGFLAQVQPGTATLNRIGYENQEFFDTYEKGCGTLDETERAKVWEECCEMLMKDYAMVPLNHKVLGAIVRDDIDGFWWAPDYEEIYLYELSRK